MKAFRILIGANASWQKAREEWDINQRPEGNIKTRKGK